MSGLLKKGVISEQEYGMYIDQINNIRTLSKTKEDAARKIRYLITGGLATVAPFGVRKALGY